MPNAYDWIADPSTETEARNRALAALLQVEWLGRQVLSIVRTPNDLFPRRGDGWGIVFERQGQ